MVTPLNGHMRFQFNVRKFDYNNMSCYPFTPSDSVNAESTLMMLATQSLLKTMELFQNRLQIHSGVTPFVFVEANIASVISVLTDDQSKLAIPLIIFLAGQ